MRWDGLASGMTQWQMMMAMVVLKCDVMDWWRGELLPYILIRSLHQALWSGREAVKAPPLTPAQWLISSIWYLRGSLPLPGVVAFFFPYPWGWHNGACVIKSTVPPSPFPTLQKIEKNHIMTPTKSCNYNWAFLMLAGGCSQQQHYNTYKKQILYQINNKSLHLTFQTILYISWLPALPGWLVVVLLWQGIMD